MNNTDQKETKKVWLIGLGSAFIASLCCFSPLVLVLLGLSSASFAASLSDTLYGEYKWLFRSVGLLSIVISYLFWYRRKSQSCTLDQKKRLRQKMLNLFLLTVLIFIIAYIVWLYVVVEYFGIQAGIWEVPKWFPFLSN